jgi:hypothetical protein
VLHCTFELLASVKRYDTASCNWDCFTGLRVSPGTWGLVTNLKVTKSGKLYRLSPSQRVTDLFKESINNVFGLALIQPDAVEQ